MSAKFVKAPVPEAPPEPEPTATETAMEMAVAGIEKLGVVGIGIAVVSIAIIVALAVLGRKTDGGRPPPRAGTRGSRGSGRGGDYSIELGGDGDGD